MIGNDESCTFEFIGTNFEVANNVLTWQEKDILPLPGTIIRKFFVFRPMENDPVGVGLLLMLQCGHGKKCHLVKVLGAGLYVIFPLCEKRRKKGPKALPTQP